jgi:hypothetical protein
LRGIRGTPNLILVVAHHAEGHGQSSDGLQQGGVDEITESQKDDGQTRVYRESVGRVVDEKTRELLAALLAYPDVDSEWKNPVALGFMPVIPMSFVKDGQLLNYFSMVMTVGTPQTVAARELRIECMFLADEMTETRHLALMSAART